MSPDPRTVPQDLVALCRRRAWRPAFPAQRLRPPEIAAPVDALPLRFNPSHGRGRRLRGHRTAGAGIDVERTAVLAPLDLVAAYFSAEERRALRALPAARQDARFYWLWTLKETYLEALGLGLQQPLDSFSIRDGATITVASATVPGRRR